MKQFCKPRIDQLAFTPQHTSAVVVNRSCCSALSIGLALVLGAPVASRAEVVNLPVAADTFITSGNPNNNAGANAWIDAGTDGPSGGNAVRRALLRFDLDSIPPGSTITSAMVRLTVTKVPAISPVNSSFNLFRLQAAWGEGTRIGTSGALATSGEATWNERFFGTLNWTAPGAMSDAAASASASASVSSSSGQVVSWNSSGLINDVQFWRDNPAQNFGWLLASQAEGSSRSVRGFGSRESGATSGTLQVGYTPPAAANVPPTVAITNLTNGSTFIAGALLTVEAGASDTDGSVSRVEFFDGATSLGSDPTSPYSITTTLYTGAHVLRAMATDDDGATTISATVTNTGVTVPIPNPIAERIPKGDLTIELQTIADGMAAPIGMAVPDDDSGRMFVYDQDGRIWVVNGSGRLATPLLDLRSRLVLLGAYDERGLLGLAVHSDFAANPLIYTYTSEPYRGSADFQNGLGAANNHQSVIAEWRLSSDNTNVVDTASRREILRIDQPQSNHNGGTMRFGPDGRLYVVLGDGGQADDSGAGHVPGGNAQDLNRIWGKLIRINVDGNNSANGQYSVPLDNPFVGSDGLDEIWAYGFRNPFTFSFERGTGALYLADVGQNRVEEINLLTKGGNYGWNIKEGSFWFDGAGSIVTAPVRPVPPGLIDPIAQYDHDDGLAVIGGFVYHGSAIAALQNRFAFGDWGSFAAPSGRLFYLDATNGIKELRIGVEDRPLGLWLRGYGEGPDGELYMFCSRQLGPTGNTGRMLKLVPVPSSIEIASLSLNDGEILEARWAGGTGPFALQKKATVADPAWVNVAFTKTNVAETALTGQAGFLRVFDAAHEPPIPLTVYMSGAAERPMTNNSPALGTGIFSLDGNTLTFNVRYSGLTAPASAAHIHGPADTSLAAGVLISLAPYNGGTWNTNGTLSGVILLTDDQRAMILACQTYVNIHTANFPGGEIRGQLVPANMQAALSGANERPDPVRTTAHGLANLALVGNQLTFNVTYRGLSGTATASHIHGPASIALPAGVFANLGPFNGGTYGTDGSLSGTVTLTPAQLAWVIDGLAYINFHTPNNPGGEIRGQIVPHATGVPLTALLSGLAEHPPLTHSAAGSGTFSLEDLTLTFNINYSGLSSPATAAHIHGYTNTSGNAGVLVSLVPFNGGAFGINGTLSGSVALTPAQRNGLLNGLTYVNFHTAANPGGELRGQIAPVTMFATLSGNNVRPAPVAAPASGSGTFALVRDQLSLSVTYQGLLSPATASHIHGPTPGGFLQGAGVLVPLDPYNGGAYGASGSLAGLVSLNFANLLTLIDAQTYVNFHTTNFPGGEVRGQIMR